MKKFKISFLLLTTLCSFLPAILSGQVDTAWTRRWTSAGPNGDYVYGLAVDDEGNVYVTGGKDYLGTSPELLTIKYNASGDTVWTRVPVRTGSQRASAVAVGASGNVYITGYTYEAGTGDYITIKYRPNGDEAWARLYNHTGNSYDFARKLVLDSMENVYITGYAKATGSKDVSVTIKYDSSGTQLWARQDSFSGAYGIGYPTDLGLDYSGNPYIVSKTKTASSGTDYVVAKYNPANGDTLWVRTYNGVGNYTDEARAIAFDVSNNVYVTGLSAGSSTGNYDYNIVTIKYNSAGTQQWVRSYSNPDTTASDGGYWIAVDGSGNAYVYGSSYGTGGANQDLVLIKYNTSGVEQWVEKYNGPGGYDAPIDKDGQKGMALDLSGNIYFAGTSRQAGSTNENDYVTVKYNPNGVEQWRVRYDCCDSFETAYSIDVDNSGNVYVTGRSVAVGSYYDILTIKYTQTQGIEEARGQMQEARSIEVYPNPAKAFFVVRLPLSADRQTLKMYDVSGKVVKVEELQSLRVQEFRISLKGINPGLYFLQLNNKPVTEKLVITK